MIPIIICSEEEPELSRVDSIRASIELRKKVIEKIKKELPTLNRLAQSKKSPRKIRMTRALLKTRTDKLAELQFRNSRLSELLKRLEGPSKSLHR